MQYGGEKDKMMRGNNAYFFYASLKVKRVNLSIGPLTY